nr:hypothetical protein [Bacteroidota bacterium]
MNRYPILVLIFLSLLFQQCSHKTKKDSKSTQEELSYKLPKLLIITSGTEEGYGKLAQGIVIAIQTFTANGVLTSIKSRDILNRPEELEGYNFMLLSTALGYHDADRRYSLSYMSDFELDNIRNFVKIGGVLIAGDNVGRNQLDGNDRISLYGQLNPSNWALSDCFGLCLQELNMKNYRLNGFLDSNLNGQFKDTSATDLWILVGDSIHSSNLKQWAKWENGENQYPAIVQNEFGKGIGFLLPSSYYLHPANDGGYWSALQIESFYKLTIHAFNEKNKNKISINPWPNGYEQAFCISLNASGSLKEMKRLSDYFKQVNITPTYFVNGKIKDEAIDFLKKCELQSNGFARINYRNVLYPESKTDMYENEVFWDKQFKGFRFPYTRSGFWGLLALDELGYSYESSIGADNIEQYLGCVFPYHIPISNNNYYKTTSILDLS